METQEVQPFCPQVETHEVQPLAPQVEVQEVQPFCPHVDVHEVQPFEPQVEVQEVQPFEPQVEVQEVQLFEPQVEVQVPLQPPEHAVTHNPVQDVVQDDAPVTGSFSKAAIQAVIFALSKSLGISFPTAAVDKLPYVFTFNKGVMTKLPCVA